MWWAVESPRNSDSNGNGEGPTKTLAKVEGKALHMVAKEQEMAAKEKILVPRVIILRRHSLG